MKKYILLLALFLNLSFVNKIVSQEKFSTKNGNIVFVSEAVLNKFQGVNNRVFSTLDAKEGSLDFSVLIKAFKFDEVLMEEHFNDNYMETKLYPKATFKGKIERVASINFQKNGTYTTAVAGDITIHGVTKPIRANATIQITDGIVKASSSFKVKVEDFNIAIPTVVSGKIAKEMSITVECDYTPLIVSNK